MYNFLCGNTTPVVFSKQLTGNAIVTLRKITGMVIGQITVPVAGGKN
jgi:hypothetical protein